MSEPSDENKQVSEFAEYKKLCQAVFHRASQSQLKYLQSLIELQQSMLTSCNGIVAKQLAAAEKYAKENENSAAILSYHFGIFTGVIDVWIELIKLGYDAGTIRLDNYKKTVSLVSEGLDMPIETK